MAVKIRKLTKLLNTLLGINMSWDFLDGPVVKTCDSTAKGLGLILDLGTKILHPTWCRKKRKREICVHVLRIHSWV